MNKSSFVVIVLGVLSSADATANVTLWGIADTWVGQNDVKVGAAPGKTTVLESGGAQASRWGIRGEESLGGGLRARFALEQGISVDTGTVTNVSASDNGFNRAAWVGLGSAYGEVRFGRMLTAFDALRGSTNHLYDSSGFASTGQVWSAGATAARGVPAVSGSDYLARGNNTLYYGSPMIGPFRGSLSMSLDERASTATSAPRMVTGHVEYASGPARIGYGFQDERYATGYNKFRIIAGHYAFGVARFVGAYQRQVDERVPGHQKSNEFEVGFNVPFGAATVAVGYAKANTKNAAGLTVVDADGLSLMATYDLSKRTRLYTAFRRIVVDRADGKATSKVTRYGVGMTHAF
ncbi:porin [Cupriavidus sp. YAF13]|uniref:porin n=1 Tax=Cupriavidus sp. YAF13 TaxID=3233075 RepID=UPI003F93D1A5